MESENGSFKYIPCRLTPDVVTKINESHANTLTLMKYAQHLEKLDALTDIRDHLMRSATGRDQIPTKTAMLIFKILGFVIAILAFAIGALLMGERLGLILPLSHG